uniref:HOOK N-terminal domain-containing protein n=1 Tax=Acanthochromis polyacanthus TaxID=80966 RepID=A0A3Q1EGW6_9TELE
KILKSMLEYYHDVLGNQVSDEHLPDVNLIGEMGDVTELGKLVQLVLGCAVSCEKKQGKLPIELRERKQRQPAVGITHRINWT